MVVKSGVNVVREVVGKDSGDGSYSMIGKREASLCRSRDWRSGERLTSSKNRHISRSGGVGGHWGSVVFSMRRGHIDIVGVNGDIVMEWSKKEGIE